MTQNNTTKSGHLLYLDYLRLLGTLAVVLAHVAGQNLGTVEVLADSWKVFRVTDLALLWSVPVFVMISGALFLDSDRPLPLKKLYGKNLLKIVTAFLFWAFVYALEKLLAGDGVKAALTMFLEGRYHMWYLFLIAGLYIAAPLLRKITESKQLTEYFLLAFFLIRILLPELVSVLAWLEIPHVASLLDIVRLRLEDMSFGFAGVYTFYFVLGCYLAKYEIKPTLRRLSYAAGLLAWVLAIALQLYSAGMTGSGSKPFDYTLFTAAMALCIFLFAKYTLNGVPLKERTIRWVGRASGLTFGVYLVHPLVLSQLRDTFGLNTLTFGPVTSVLLVGIITVTVSFALSWILHHVPVLKKYVV